jgi:asparagine synthase (glutamine-hydrolysing)
MLRLTPVRVAPSECSEGLRDTFVIDRAPVGWPQAPWDIALTRRSHEHGATLLLSGAGGDEVFGGNFRIYAERARQGHVISALLSVIRLKGWGLPTKRRLRLLLLDPLIASSMPRVLHEAGEALRPSRGAPSWAGPQLRRFLTGGGLEFENHFEVCPSQGERTWLQALARSGLYLYTSEARAHAELAGGCKRSEPFLDDDVVEFVASLRPEVLSHDDWARGLFRHAMRGLVPETLRLRQDKSRFGPALHEVLEAAGGFSSLEPLMKTTALADMGLVEPKRLRKRFDDFVRSPTAGGLWVELWPVLAGEAFVRQSPSLS